MRPWRLPISYPAWLVLASVPLALGGAAERVRGDSIANFWLGVSDLGPSVPVIYALPGVVGEFDVWARPANGYRLAAFSLDVQSTSPGVAPFTSVEVLNPQMQGLPEVFRHQLVFDSSTGLFVEADEIYGLLGLSFYDDVLGLPNGAGIGSLCGIDPECSNASGAAAYRVATVQYQAGLALGSTELFLAIGEQGLWQSPAIAIEPDEPTDTSAVFGLPNDAVNQWATHFGVDHRHDPQGLADAVIQVASADFNEDGFVNGGDFLVWQRGLGVGSTLKEGDANGDNQVDGTDLAVWRFQFGAAGSVVPVGSTVPEPTGLVALATIVTLFRSRLPRDVRTRVQD